MQLEQDRTVLLGFDFAFCYPSGFANHARAAFGSQGAPWLRIWRYLEATVTDTCGNLNNRFTVASDINRLTNTAYFWGHPMSRYYSHLRPRKAHPRRGLNAPPVPALRCTEVVAAGGVKSVWQLFFGPTVGSQVITGIPYLERLRRKFEREIVIWPFETGFVGNPFIARPTARVVLVEIWPRLFTPGKSGDQAEVEAAVAACVAQQSGGGLAQWFDPPVIRGKAQEQAQAREEGWILSVV